MQFFAFLDNSFNAVRVNFSQFKARKRDLFDLGVVQRVYKPKDKVRVLIKSCQQTPAKYLSLWSDIY